MAPVFPLHQIRGPFNFLRLAQDEVDSLFPDIHRTLPAPLLIYLDDEAATPIHGFPILDSPALATLGDALAEYVEAEEGVQVAVLRREPSDRGKLTQAWERYRRLLMQAVENVTLSSYGRNFPAIFWLHHSQKVARLLKDTPRRVRRIDLEAGRRHGQTVRYRVLERYLDHVFAETYDLVSRLSRETEEVEEELFPRLLTRLKDNVLLLTEDHVSHDLGELAGYFQGYLGIDGRDFRSRLANLEEWHRERLTSDAELVAMVEHLLPDNGVAEVHGDTARQLLVRRGYVTYLSRRQDYRGALGGGGLLDDHQVGVWERLLLKLKEFELVHGLRRMIVPAQPGGPGTEQPPEPESHSLGTNPGRPVPAGPATPGTLVHKGPAARAAGASELVLSSATRPLDFLAPWVVDPQVSRFGLIYDITDFSEIVTLLRRAGSEEQDGSFRQMFRLQRRIHHVAEARRLRLEKYLGDGAFYSARQAVGLLSTAIHVQRIYSDALAEDFPFDRGMRIALNFSQYRLIPIATARRGEPERYEFFGHGVIELSRLTTGKAKREIEDLKTMLITQGYPEHTVQRFFSPLLHRDVDLVEKGESSRHFYAYINKNGHLVNEGIVATEPLVRALRRELAGVALGRVVEGERSYVVLEVDEGVGAAPLVVGVRSLGRASLKGLERMPVYEIVDGEGWERDEIEPVTTVDLVEAVERNEMGTLRVAVDPDDAGTLPGVVG